MINSKAQAISPKPDARKWSIPGHARKGVEEFHELWLLAPLHLLTGTAREPVLDIRWTLTKHYY